jgi:hypothetical protein
VNFGNIRIDCQQLLKIAFCFIVVPSGQCLLSRLRVSLQGFVLELCAARLEPELTTIKTKPCKTTPLILTAMHASVPFVRKFVPLRPGSKNR